VVVDREFGTSRDFDVVNSGRRVNIYLERSAEIVGLLGYNRSLGVLLESVMTVWKGGFAACGFAYKLGCDSKQLRSSAECW
jgi:hypothetical protein